MLETTLSDRTNITIEYGHGTSCVLTTSHKIVNTFSSFCSSVDLNRMTMMMNNNDDEAHSYEGLLFTSSSNHHNNNNKRSFTDHLVDYVKKTKLLLPCAIPSPSRKLTNDPHIIDTLNKQQQQPKRGSLCLAHSFSTDNSILTLHVIRARHLLVVGTDVIHSLDTFVKVTLPNQFEYCSKIIHNSNSPFYDETFQIPYNNNNNSSVRRLTISVYNQSISNNKSDLIGCMSFNMKTLLKTSSCTKSSSKYKWYCLLPESIGRHKRMALNVEISSSSHSKKLTTTNQRRTHSSSATKNTNGLLLNVDVYDRDEIQFGSGFPCTVSEVKPGIGSSCTRPMPGDILLQVNQINVSRTQAKAVNKLMRSLPYPITLQLYRRSSSSSSSRQPSVKVDKIVLNSVDQHQPLHENLMFFGKSNQNYQLHDYSFSDTYADRAFCSSDKPLADEYDQVSNCLLPETVVINTVEQQQQQQSLLMSPIQRVQSKTTEQSDGSESGVGSESNPYSDGEHRLKTVSEAYEREALHLIGLEKQFIAQLELGVQLYSRPLKHYLISSHEHARLFQNIEKILAISRYQLNRLQSLSEATIVAHVGRIFHEKLQLICEAFARYSSGYTDACLQLKQLEKCASFQRFIHNASNVLSIEQFLQIPLNHIENLANHLDILCCTCENGNDANYLLHVLKELRQCALHSSIESSSSAITHHCTTTMTLNSANGTTTISSLMATSNSSSTLQNEDNDIIELQNRLQFANNIQPVTLIGRNRHVIFSGVLLLQNESKTFIETWAVLLNDMLLFTQRNAVDTRLTLVCDAIPLTEIVDFRSSNERQDALIFLSNKPTGPFKLRYPSKCLQCAWQTILEQRLKTWQRSIHDESSSADSDLEE